jgi:hypothetical protein
MPMDELSRPTVVHVRPAFDDDSRFQEATNCVYCMPYLTRAIADNPIALQCEEPNLSTESFGYDTGTITVRCASARYDGSDMS